MLNPDYVSSKFFFSFKPTSNIDKPHSHKIVFTITYLLEKL